MREPGFEGRWCSTIGRPDTVWIAKLHPVRPPISVRVHVTECLGPDLQVNVDELNLTQRTVHDLHKTFTFFYIISLCLKRRLHKHLAIRSVQLIPGGDVTPFLCLLLGIL